MATDNTEVIEETEIQESSGQDEALLQSAIQELIEKKNDLEQGIALLESNKKELEIFLTNELQKRNTLSDEAKTLEDSVKRSKKILEEAEKKSQAKIEANEKEATKIIEEATKVLADIRLREEDVLQKQKNIEQKSFSQNEKELELRELIKENKVSKEQSLVLLKELTSEEERLENKKAEIDKAYLKSTNDFLELTAKKEEFEEYKQNIIEREQSLRVEEQRITKLNNTNASHIHSLASIKDEMFNISKLFRQNLSEYFLQAGGKVPPSLAEASAPVKILAIQEILKTLSEQDGERIIEDIKRLLPTYFN